MTAALVAVPWHTRVLIRVLDIVIASVAVLLFLPVLLGVMVVLRCTGEGEVFYRQTRIGRHGKPFGLLKFATMLKHSASIGSGELTLPQDSRVLPFGRFLRKTKLNELPQLFNILKGDLSMIGPRPQTLRYYNAYHPEDRAYIAQVRPGLSGVGSVLFRDEENIIAKVADPVRFDDEVITPYKGQVERWFVCHQSLGHYLELIITTILVVLQPERGHHRKLLARVPAPPAELRDLL